MRIASLPLPLFQAFKGLDKRAALAAIAAETWTDAVESERAVIEPERLLRFLLLTFADLKKSAFLHWFAFPTLGNQALFRLSSRPAPASSVLSVAEGSLVVQGLAALWFQSLGGAGRPGCPPFFVVVVTRSGEGGGLETQSLKVLSLLEYEGGREVARDAGEESVKGEVLFGFVDPCSEPRGTPGWPLRNFLMLLSARWGVKLARVLCFRERVPRPTLAGGGGSAASEGLVPDGELARRKLMGGGPRGSGRSERAFV